MKVLQINTTVNSGSTGRIAEDLGQILISNGYKSFIAYGRASQPSASVVFQIGNKISVLWHVFITRIFDRHAFASGKATTHLIKWIKQVKPDIIHFHCLHGYYINIRILFEYLETAGIPIVWTFHDAWAFTGHCTYFDYKNCFKWRTKCEKCPNLHAYPASLFYDNSTLNYIDKKTLFTKMKSMTIVSPSKWLGNYAQESFLKKYPVEIINNGINLEIFKPVDTEKVKDTYSLKNKHIVLGVASVWSHRKGLYDFIRLRSMLDNSYLLILVGLNKKQQKGLPEGIICIERTENINELASLYSVADVFVNPTLVDNFPTTNIESLACGTPVVTYNTGGSPEAIDVNTGLVTPKGDVVKLRDAIVEIISNGKNSYSQACRQRALAMFDKKDRYEDYLSLYHKMLKKNE